MFRAYVQYEYGTSNLLSWGPDINLHDTHAIMLAIFDRGQHAQACSVIEAQMGALTEVLWVVPANPPQEGHASPLKVSLVAEPGYFGKDLFVSTYWVGRYVGNEPDYWDVEKGSWRLWEILTVGTNVPQGSILSLEEALALGLKISAELGCPLDFWSPAAERHVINRAKAQVPQTRYSLIVAGRLEAAFAAMQEHNNSLEVSQ